ncbi:MAG: glutathione S-transferase family protein [Gammaproteobacteria bacterium]|nr:MAG: glutathione S-transferase family protein [Gammaproteobacteria bacterium]
MKLYYNAASPYVRKVRVFAMETGLMDDIELAAVTITPVGPDAELCADNPIGKIPTLVRDDGGALYDSRVICEYLDGLHGGASMFPENEDQRWTALRRQALADGILDAAVNTRYETFLRPPELRWPDWVDGQMTKVRRSLDQVEAESLGDGVDIGTISVACALGYLDFRYRDEAWRDTRPKLAAWFEAFAARPSMSQTRPG